MLALLNRRAALMLGIAGSVALPSVACAELGVFDNRIVFGQSAAFEGPAAALGLGMREGILAAFSEANAAGGVNGPRSIWCPTTTATSRKRRSPTPSA